MTTFTVPANIDPTGNTDVTAKLQAWLNPLPNGAVVVWNDTATPRRYRLNGTLEIDGKEQWEFVGTNTFLFAGTDGTEFPAAQARTRSQLRIRDGLQWKIHGFDIRGANPNGGLADSAYVEALEAQHGFEIEHCVGIEFAANTIHDVYGDFVNVSGSNGKPSSWVNVHNNTFMRNGRQGVSITNASVVAVQNNWLDAMRRTVFDLEPPTLTWTVDTVSITRNVVGAHRLNFFSSQGQGPVNSVTIDSNQCSTYLNGVCLPPTGQRRSNWRVTNNTGLALYGTPSGKVESFTNIDGLVVAGNRQVCDSRISSFFNATGCTNVTQLPANLLH